jgi:opacity protein-like surface antigen
MKKILLATALAAVSISATEANWGGFYARGGLAGGGEGSTTKQDDKVAGGHFNLNMLFEVAAGWGMTVGNAVYLGVDAQVGNFGIVHNSTDAIEVPVKVDGGSSTDFSVMPSLQFRVGLPLKSAMPYIAGGIGAIKSFKETPNAKGEKTTKDMKFSWSARLGSDFKVTENFFVGVYGQFTRTFEKELIEGSKTKESNSGISVGFTAGYQF